MTTQPLTVSAAQLFRCIAIAVIGVLAGCSDQHNETEQEGLPVTTKQNVSPRPAAPNYEDREGERYFYVAAVSEEDQEKGKATGNVSTFRYLGSKDGVYRIELISENGQSIATAECKRPCKVTKTIWIDGRVTRGGYNPESILGSAFEDAFNGYLVVGRSQESVPAALTARVAKHDIIPARFVGEWNENPADCGTDNNDTRLRITPNELLFYESKASVQQVTVEDARTIAVKGSFSGEGQTWTDSYRMALTQSGNELLSGELTRKRCP